jgi:hypothetical protein
MTVGAVIGALRVVIGADSAALTTELDRTRGALAAFGADVAKTGAMIGVAITAAYAAVGLGVNNAISQMAEFSKQSQKIGVPVETLSALKLAADESGVSMEQLTKGVGKLSKAMVEAASKPTSQAADAFRALGVSVTDAEGKIRPTQDIITSIAGKFEGLKDGAGKTAVSIALFGKSGAEMIPMLNMGADGLGRMMEQAAKFGIVIDTQTATAAKHFTDTLVQLGAAKDGIIVKLTEYMLPALKAFADRLLETASSTDKQQSKLSILKTGFDIFARAVLLVADNFRILLQLGAVFVGAQIGAAVISMGLAFVRLAAAIRATGIVMAAFEAIRGLSMRGILLMVGIVALMTGQFDNLKSGLSDVTSKIESVMPKGVTEAIHGALDLLGVDLKALEADLTKVGTTTETTTTKQKEFNYQLMGGKDAVDKFINSQNKSIAAQNAAAQTEGMAAGNKERLRATMEAYQVAAANNIPITDALRQKIYDLGIAAQNSALLLQGAQLVQSNLTPAEQFQQSMTNNTLAMQAFGASAESIGRMQKKLAEDSGTAWNVAGASIAGSFEDIAGAFGKNSSAMATAAKVFGAIQATISMFTGAAKALELPFPANLAAMAVVLAKGAAFVASIKSTAIPKYKQGADFKVPGGLGGGDKVPVSFMAEPGEQVTVRSNNDRGRSGGGGMVNIMLQGDNFSRQGVRDLIGKINEAIGDGARLKVAPA